MIRTIALPLFVASLLSTPALAAFEKVRCDGDIPKALIGQRIGNRGRGSSRQCEIVGVVGDAKYGTVREARGFTSSTYTVSSLMAYCTFIRPITFSAFAMRRV